MLEERLNLTRSSLVQVVSETNFAQKRLSKSTDLLESLKPENLASGKPNTEFRLGAFLPKQDLAWEQRMGVLHRIVNVRGRLSTFSVPKYNEQTEKLEKEQQVLKDQEKEIIGEIENQLITDREFIQIGIKNGHLHSKELSWIDSQFPRFGLDLPQAVEVKPSALEVFLKNPKTPGFIKELSRSSEMPFVLQCVNESLNDPSIDLKQLKNSLCGYIFERAAYKVTRSSMIASVKAPVLLISPDLTFDIFRSVYKDKGILTEFHGLQKGLAGVSIPDGIVVALYGNDEAEFSNITEYSMTNLNRPGKSADGKQKQLDNYQMYDSFVFQGLASWAERYNKKQLNVPSLFDAHPALAGRKFKVRTPQAGFGLLYFMAEKQKPPAGVPIERTGELKINPSHIANFADAIISTAQSQKS